MGLSLVELYEVLDGEFYKEEVHYLSNLCFTIKPEIVGCKLTNGVWSCNLSLNYNVVMDALLSKLDKPSKKFALSVLDDDVFNAHRSFVAPLPASDTVESVLTKMVSNQLDPKNDPLMVDGLGKEIDRVVSEEKVKKDKDVLGQSAIDSVADDWDEMEKEESDKLDKGKSVAASFDDDEPFEPDTDKESEELADKLQEAEDKKKEEKRVKAKTKRDAKKADKLKTNTVGEEVLESVKGKSTSDCPQSLQAAYEKHNLQPLSSDYVIPEGSRIIYLEGFEHYVNKVKGILFENDIAKDCLKSSPHEGPYHCFINYGLDQEQEDALLEELNEVEEFNAISYSIEEVIEFSDYVISQGE